MLVIILQYVTQGTLARFKNNFEHQVKQNHTDYIIYFHYFDLTLQIVNMRVSYLISTLI